MLPTTASFQHPSQGLSFTAHLHFASHSQQPKRTELFMFCWVPEWKTKQIKRRPQQLTSPLKMGARLKEGCGNTITQHTFCTTYSGSVVLKGQKSVGQTDKLRLFRAESLACGKCSSAMTERTTCIVKSVLPWVQMTRWASMNLIKASSSSLFNTSTQCENTMWKCLR